MRGARWFGAAKQLTDANEPNLSAASAGAQGKLVKTSVEDVLTS